MLTGIDYFGIGILILVLCCVSQVISFICLGAYVDKIQKKREERSEAVDTTFLQLIQQLEDCLPSEEDSLPKKEKKDDRYH